MTPRATDASDNAVPSTPDTPRPGLRERKKAATMHHVQGVALDLFEKHGFAAVSIEQVAETAEVSPSTIYRYFGTKEGLVIHDEYDDRLHGFLSQGLAQGLSPADCARAGLEEIWAEHFVRDAEETARRMRLFFEVPAIQGAVSLIINEQVDKVAQEIAASGCYPFPRARVLTSAVVWAIVGVLRNWYEAEGREDMTDVRRGIDEVIGWLKAIENLEG